MSEKGEGAGNKPSVMEDPSAGKELDALFAVISNPDSSGGGGGPNAAKSGSAKAWKDRELPPSFFNASSNQGPGGGMNSPDKYSFSSDAKPMQKPFPKLGPSINLGPPQMVHSAHTRSTSMPANLESLTVNPVPLPPGWEASKTPDGLTYYIDHNRKTTTWEDPRKMMHGGAAGTHPHHPHQIPPTSMHLPMHPQQPMMSQFPAGPPPPAPHLPPHHRMPPYQHGGAGGAHLDAPLPNGWEKSMTAEGEVFYVNHKTRTTSWLHPGHHSPHHQHSHSLVNMPGHPNFPRGTAAGGGAGPPGHFRQNSPGGGGGGTGGMTLSQHLQASGEIHNRSPQQQHQRFPPVPIEHVPIGMEPKQVPTTMYGDPILSSEHVRSSSHDSGLGGPTNFPYHSETPIIDYDDSMDTSGAMSGMNSSRWGGLRGHPNHRSLDYLTDIAGTDVDSTFPDPNATAAMETDLLQGPISGEVFNSENMGGQWV